MDSKHMTVRHWRGLRGAHSYWIVSCDRCDDQSSHEIEDWHDAMASAWGHIMMGCRWADD